MRCCAPAGKFFRTSRTGALGRDGFLTLTSRGGAGPGAEGPKYREEDFAPEVEADEPAEPDPLAEEFAAIDAVLERSTKVLEGGQVPADGRAAHVTGRQSLSDLVYDLDWNEEERLAEGTRDLPSVLRAALLLDAWHDIEEWGARCCGSEARRNHLACLHLGRKKCRGSGGGPVAAASACLPFSTPCRRRLFPG